MICRVMSLSISHTAEFRERRRLTKPPFQSPETGHNRRDPKVWDLNVNDMHDQRVTFFRTFNENWSGDRIIKQPLPRLQDHRQITTRPNDIGETVSGFYSHFFASLHVHSRFVVWTKGAVDNF
jgi:hypothetical protein